MHNCPLDPVLAVTQTADPSEHNMTVIGSSDMPVMIFRQDNYTVIAVIDGEYTIDQWARAVEHITGEFDWWHGEVMPGVDAYIISQEDAHGFIGNPDWQELPVVFKSDVLAGLRRAVPARAGDEGPAVPRMVVHRR